MNKFQQLKQHISFDAILDKLNIEVCEEKGKMQKLRCPLCQQDKNMTSPVYFFLINKELQVFFCKLCKKGGDIFSFLCDYKNMSPNEVVSWLVKEFNAIISLE